MATRAAGGRLRRAEQTKDGDVLVDVCAHARVLDQVVGVLTGFGFTADEPFSGAETARCTFSGVFGQIDVLCPDDATDEMLESSGVVSLAIPGGRRALEVSELVNVVYAGDLDATMRVPLLPWAIPIKAAAALDPRTVDQDRHIQDVAGMLAVFAAHPREGTLAEADVELLVRLGPRLADDGDVAWEGMAGADVANARAGYRILVR